MRIITSKVRRLEERHQHAREVASGPCGYCVAAALGGKNRRLVFAFAERPMPDPVPCPRCGGDLNDYHVIERIEPPVSAS